MKNVRNINEEILTFQKEILNDLKPFIIDKESFLNFNNWFVSSNHLFVYSQNKKLYIAAEKATREYISYKETNLSFRFLPQQEIKVLPNETFKVKFEGDASGKIRIELFLVEYSESEKIGLHIFNLNSTKEITTSKNSKTIRLAIRISGIGLSSIRNFEMERVASFDTEPIITENEISDNRIVKSIKELKMACIFDEFTTTCYEQEVELITFNPDNWKQTLLNNRPDVLMVESAWRGNNGTWEYKVAKYNNMDKAPLIELVKWCQRHGIPTIFWNKEDPIHFEKFIDSAKLFDFIFTTDSNMIEKYQRVAGHKNVFALPFAAQPNLHNPIKISDTRINKISFAGSYYANRHRDRKKDMEEMLDLAATKGLDIFDRNYEKNKNLNRTDFSFPERFSKNIKGSLKYDEIQKAYKGYKVMLNVNSVKNSPTMFSRRVFEGLASGTPILSSYSEGIKRVFKDIVLISENSEELRQNLDKLMNDERFYREKSLEGIRDVYLNHTYKHRIKFILDNAGINVVFDMPSVTVMAVVNSIKEFNFVLKQYKTQSWKRKKLIVFLNNFDGYIDILNNYNTDDITTYVRSYMTYYQRVNELINTDYIGFFNPYDYYGENYLTDLMIGTQYSNAEIVGKSNRFVYKNKLTEVSFGKEYEFVNDLEITSSIVYPKIFKGINTEDVINMIEQSHSLKDFFKKGYRLFSIDKFNYVKSGKTINSKTKEKIEL